MAKLKTLKLNPDAVTEGVWCDWILGVKVKIARTGTPEYNTFIQKLMVEQVKSEEDVDTDEVIRKAVARHVIKDWSGIEDDDGTELSYSPEKAYELISDPALSDLYEFVMRMASDRSRFRNQEELEGK